MGDLTKQAQLLKKCVKLAVYIRSGREFVSILTMQPNNVLEKGALFGRVSEQGKQYMIRRMIVKIRSNLTAFHIEMEEQSFVIVDLNAVMTYVSRKQKEIAAGQLAGTVADNNCPLAFYNNAKYPKRQDAIRMDVCCFQSTNTDYFRRTFE